MKTRLMYSLLIIPTGRSHTSSKEQEIKTVLGAGNSRTAPQTRHTVPVRMEDPEKEREPSGTLLSPTQCYAIGSSSRAAAKSISGEL